MHAGRRALPPLRATARTNPPAVACRPPALGRVGHNGGHHREVARRQAPQMQIAHPVAAFLERLMHACFERSIGRAEPAGESQSPIAAQLFVELPLVWAEQFGRRKMVLQVNRAQLTLAFADLRCQQ